MIDTRVEDFLWILDEEVTDGLSAPFSGGWTDYRDNFLEVRFTADPDKPTPITTPVYQDSTGYSAEDPAPEKFVAYCTENEDESTPTARLTGTVSWSTSTRTDAVAAFDALAAMIVERQQFLEWIDLYIDEVCDLQIARLTRQNTALAS
jgi:hypothetical protein